MIVSDVPGTTRDTIDTVLTRGETTFVLVDTAGLRRKRRQRQGIEYYSELRALEAAERADVALVLVDASEGVVEQDLAVADVARKAGCSTLVVLSKWDIDDARPPADPRAAEPAPPPAAAGGRGLGADRARACGGCSTMSRRSSRSTSTRIPTPALNRALVELKEARPGPAGERGRRLKLLYATQTATRPPRLRIFVNDPRLVTRDYGILGRERAARALRAAGRPGLDRLPALRVNVVVVGGGSWGTAFARLLADHGHGVTLACRDAEQAAAIRETGRNPRYLTDVDLGGVAATTVDEAPVAEREPRRRRGAERGVRRRRAGAARGARRS